LLTLHSMADEQQRVYALYEQEKKRVKGVETAASNELNAKHAESFLTYWLPAVLVCWSLLVLFKLWRPVYENFPPAMIAVWLTWFFACIDVSIALTAHVPLVPAWSKAICITVAVVDVALALVAPEDYVAFHAITAWCAFTAAVTCLTAIGFHM